MRKRRAPRVLPAFLLACMVCAAAGAACAQSHGTFKLLFNALHWSAAKQEGSK